MARRKKQQIQAEGGIAPLVAARLAAQAAELVYDLLPEKAKDWVDENLGINWAKKNVLAPAVEAVSDVWEHIKNPNLTADRERERFKEEQDAKAETRLADEQAKGWVFECNDPEKGYANCVTNRKIYQLTAPKGRYVGQTGPAEDTWWFYYDPLTGEYNPKGKTLDQMNAEYGSKVRFDMNTKKWVYTPQYQKEVDRDAEDEAAETDEAKQALRDKYAADDEAERKAAQEAQWATTKTYTDMALSKQDQEIKERYAKKRGITVEQLDAENRAFDEGQTEQLDDAPQDQQPEPDQPPEQTSGAGWETNYGRIGFGAGFAGAARPFNAINKPVLNVNQQDYLAMERRGLLPDYIVDNKDRVVLWDGDYEKPLPTQQQLNEDSARLKKRNYIKKHLDENDPYLKTKADADDVDPIKKRKARRDATRTNPFRPDQDPPFDSALMPQGYDTNTPAGLPKKLVERTPWMKALKKYARRARRAAPAAAAAPAAQAQAADVNPEDFAWDVMDYANDAADNFFGVRNVNEDEQLLQEELQNLEDLMAAQRRRNDNQVARVNAAPRESQRAEINRLEELVNELTALREQRDRVRAQLGLPEIVQDA